MLEQFYAKCAEDAGADWAGTARSIIDDWLQRPGASEGHNSQKTVGLYFDGADTRSRVNVVQLDTGGNYTICRGYLRDSGLVEAPGALAELDETIRTHFESARWPRKKYFIKDGDAEVDAHRQFADYLITALLAPPE